MSRYKLFCLGFLYALIFNFYEPCFSLTNDLLDSKILDVHFSVPLELTYLNPSSNKNNRLQKNITSKHFGSSYNPPVYKTLERAIYKRMSPQQFKEYFKGEVDEERILNNYELFAYEGFRVFAQTLQSYQKFIYSLDEKIKNDKAVSARTAYIEGFDYSSFLWWETSGFHKFVHDEAEKIQKNNQGYFDYSSQVPPPIQEDRYAALFKNTYGTELDCKLHKELHQTRTTMIQLERNFPYNDHVRLVAPLVHYLAARAKAEKNSTTAWELSKFCSTLTSVVSKCAHILDTCLKTSKSIGKGLIKGAKKVLTVEHWKEMATGALQLGLLLAEAVNQHDENDHAAHAALFSNDNDALFKFEQDYALNVKNHVRAINQSIQKTYEKMKTMTWEQLLENGVEVGTTLVLDIVTLNVVNGLACRTSRMVVEEIGRALEQGTRYATEECMVEVAGFGKLVIEEGPEVAKIALEISNTIEAGGSAMNTFDGIHDTLNILKAATELSPEVTKRICKTLIADQEFINSKFLGSNITDKLKNFVSRVKQKIVKKRIQTGAQEISSKDFLAGEAWAEKQYEFIRQCTDDVQKIVQYTGFPIHKVNRIKKHLFYDEHVLYNGVERLYPSKPIAEAWGRLSSGSFTLDDLRLLEHEYFEAKFETIFKTTNRIAHDKTELRRPSPLVGQ